MARMTSVAAVVAVLVLPGAAALAGFLLAPDTPPSNVPAVVRIGESLPSPPSTSPPSTLPPAAPTTTTPLRPPPPINDGDDDGEDDDDG